MLIETYIVLTAVGAIAFAVLGTRMNTRTRPVGTPAPELAKAA